MKDFTLLKPGLSVWPEEACLVSELAGEISQLGKFNLKDLALVFPTQRLGVHLLAQLTSSFEAFPSPNIMSFDHFIKDSLDGDELTESVISDLACELILGSLLKEKKYKNLVVGDEHEIKQLFCELVETNLYETSFDTMREVFQIDVYRSEHHLQIMLDKVDELQDLYQEFRKILESKHMILRDDYYKEVARRLQNKWHIKEDLPWKWIYFVGFTTLRSDFVDLLQKLLEFDKVSVWLTKAPKLLNSINPLKILGDKLSSHTIKRTCKFSKKLKNNIIQIKQVSSPLAETLEAFKLAESYCKQGISPSKIGILVSCEKTYANLVRVLFNKNELKANIAVSLKLSQTILGSWFSSLVSFARKKQEKTELISFLFNPITLQYLKHEDKKGTFEQEKLCYLLVQSKEKRGFKKILRSLGDVTLEDLLLRLYDEVKHFVESFTYASQKRTLKDWTDLIDDLFVSFKIYSESYIADSGLSKSVITCAYQFVDALVSAYTCFNPVIEADQIWDLLHKKILSLEVRSVGYPLEGVQILRLIESRYIPFDSVMILGCVEGKFPKKLPKDYILDDWLKKKIGLPGWDYVEALEDTTFHLLKKRIQILDLFYPKAEKNKQNVPSRFLEIEKSYEKISTVILKNDWTYFFGQSSNIKKARALKFNIDHANMFLEMSAKSSSFLLNCPYRFLIYSLKLEPTRFFRNTDVLEEGEVLHKILELFSKGVRHSKLNLESLPRALPKDKLHEILLERLQKITLDLFGSRLSKVLVYHLLNYSWPKFVHFFKSFYKESNNSTVELKIKKSYRELNFGGKYSDIKTPVLTLGDSGSKNEKLFLRGSIDSLDLLAQDFVLMDYKRKTVPTQKDQAKYQDIQLLFYALVYSLSFNTPLASGVSGYWSILEGKWHPRSVGKSFDSQDELANFKAPKKESLVESTQKFRDTLLASVAKYSQEFSVFEKRPGPQCERCDYSDFCQPDL